MPVGTIVLGEDAVIEASADGLAFEPVSDLTSYSYTRNRTINNIAVFQRATAHGVPGVREEALNLNGLYSAGDSGQDLIRAAEEGNTNIFIRLHPNGTDGIMQEFRVGSTSQDGTPENPGEATFELAAADAATPVGGGL